MSRPGHRPGQNALIEDVVTALVAANPQIPNRPTHHQNWHLLKIRRPPARTAFVEMWHSAAAAIFGSQQQSIVF